MANEKWWEEIADEMSEATFDDPMFWKERDVYISRIVAEAERRGYERAMEEVKNNSELPTPQEERDFYRYVYSKSALSQPACLHDGCTNCQGRGVDSLGRLCVHAISCPCSKHNVVC